LQPRRDTVTDDLAHLVVVLRKRVNGLRVEGVQHAADQPRHEGVACADGIDNRRRDTGNVEAMFATDEHGRSVRSAGHDNESCAQRPGLRVFVFRHRRCDPSQILVGHLHEVGTSNPGFNAVAHALRVFHAACRCGAGVRIE
jgi:hypothetical protein